MNNLDVKDTLSMIQTDLQGMALLLFSRAEVPNLYDLPKQFELFSYISSFLLWDSELPSVDLDRQLSAACRVFYSFTSPKISS